MDYTLVVLLLVVILLFLYKPNRYQIKVDGYKTHYFDEYSKKKSLEMTEAGLSDQSLKEFAIMQDLLLQYQHDTVCRRMPRLPEAIQLTKQIQERFAGFDFDRHSLYIEQMQNPTLKVNKDLICSL
jgi:uncharacterized membrane protein